MGQAEPVSRFSQIFVDFRFSWELQHFGGAECRRKPQETADFRREPQKNFAEARLSHIVCPFLFLPANSPVSEALLPGNASFSKKSTQNQ